MHGLLKDTKITAREIYSYLLNSYDKSEPPEVAEEKLRNLTARKTDTVASLQSNIVRLAEQSALGYPADQREFIKAIPEIRKKEAAKAAQILGLDYRKNLAWPDSKLVDNIQYRLELAQIIRELKPTVVIAPYYKDRHPDHVSVAHIAPAALHLAGLANAPLEGKSHKPKDLYYYMGNAQFEANLIVDTSDYIDIWEASVAAYESQFSGTAASETVTPDVFRRRKARAAYWGSFINTQYGEPLISAKPLNYFPL